MYRLRGFGAVPSSAVQQALANASNTYGVPLPLLSAVAKAESGYNPGVTSSAGAAGLMQIMPTNFSTLGVSDPFDPDQSANAGAKYLSQLHSEYGDWGTALIAYNEGPGNLANRGVFPSSQRYADAILADAGLAPDAATPAASASSGGGVDSGPYDLSSLDQTGMSPAAVAGIGLVAAGLVIWALG